MLGLGMLITTAMISRIAKAFQDYVVNVIIQKFGASIYTDGLQHALRLPYKDFEDQRSGETLGKLQKVRSDVEKLIAIAVNLLFTTVIGVIIVMVYSFRIYWAIGPAFLLTIPLQMFAYHTAAKLGRDIDKPRNLAKSVTVE